MISALFLLLQLLTIKRQKNEVKRKPWSKNEKTLKTLKKKRQQTKPSQFGRREVISPLFHAMNETKCMRILSVHRKLSVLERCPYGEIRLYLVIFIMCGSFLILCTADKIHLLLEVDCVKVVMAIVIKTKYDALNTLVWSHLEHNWTIN